MSETWNLDSQLAYLRSWLRPDLVDFKRDRPRRNLELRLTQHEPATINHLASAVGSIAMWEYQLGSFQVLMGDSSGWGHLYLAVECDVWRIRILLHQHSTTEEPDKEFAATHDTALALASAIALRDDALADWCGALLAREFAHPVFLTDWEHSPVFQFLTWMYALWRGVTIDAHHAPVGSFGVYGQVIANWGDDAAQVCALHKACEYHCAQAIPDETEQIMPEFTDPPYIVFPGEILAILRVREELIGRRVEIDHPLMNSPLGTVPPTIPKLHDPLIEQFKARVQAEEDSRAG
jgi:hypothetical protein